MTLRWPSQTSIVLLIIAVATAGAAAQSRPVSSRPPSSRPAEGSLQDPTASLSGTIMDSMNQPVSGARVAITSDERGFQRVLSQGPAGAHDVPSGGSRGGRAYRDRGHCDCVSSAQGRAYITGYWQAAVPSPGRAGRCLLRSIATLEQWDWSAPARRSPPRVSAPRRGCAMRLPRARALPPWALSALPRARAGRRA